MNQTIPQFGKTELFSQLTSDIRVGDAAKLLRQLPAQSVHCVVTSPPYFKLRDYGHDGQIGQEQTPERYIKSLVKVFRQVKRVLRDDGSLYVNIGDTYAGDNRWGIPRKSLLGIPWALAFALRKDGWIIRQENIWHKKNTTPESARDRTSRVHEQVFHLVKSTKYYYDREDIREPNQDKPPTGRKAAHLAHSARLSARAVRRSTPVCSTNVGSGAWAEREEAHSGFVAYNPRGRNKRSVWTTTTGSFKAKSVGIHDVTHFAVFPPDLIRPCILSGTSAYGCCAACGSPYTRHIEAWEDLEDTWVPSCACPPEVGVVPCTVLDIFAGSGTTGVVCLEEKRNFVGLELNPAYARLAQARLLSAVQRIAGGV